MTPPYKTKAVNSEQATRRLPNHRLITCRGVLRLALSKDRSFRPMLSLMNKRDVLGEFRLQ